MSCIMKYRAKGSNKEWAFYEAGDERHCTDYLIDCEFEEDMEYEIYKFSSDGTVHGVYKYEDEEYETKLEYLLRIYQCENVESLKNKIPININLIDLDCIATDEFKEALSELNIDR